MAVYILSTLLITILAFAIVQLSKKSEVEAEIEKLKQRHQLSLLTELRAAEKVVWLCFAGGLLLTANYAITYFSGSELVNIPHWGFLQWSGALIGLVIAVSITFVQKVLYSSPTHSKAGLIVTTLVLTFVIISEIGAPIEKEGMKMKEASQNSAVFKAVVGQIQGSTDATSNYSKPIAIAKAEKAQHEFELQRCERHQSKGEQRVQRCQDYENKHIIQAQAKIDSYQSSANSTTSSNETSRQNLIQYAKALEHNTDHHSELVKLTASVLGANFLASMMFLSLVLIVAFEAGFHFVGSRVGVLKATLGELGNKEILREQELASLKKEKYFNDEANRVPTATATVGTQSSAKNKTASTSPEKPDKTLLKSINFDELYAHVKQQLTTGKISFSIRNMRKIVHQHLKRNPSLAKVSISITSSNYLVDKIRDKMLDAQFILKNPNYSKGKAKYLLAKPIRPDSSDQPNSSTSNIVST